MSDERSTACTCPLCQGLADMPRALGALRADETGHDRGCECDACGQYGPSDVREAMDCSWEPGAHQWLTDFYLTVIEPDRIDLYRAPQWARDLAAIGDSVVAKERCKNQRDLEEQMSAPAASPSRHG